MKYAYISICILILFLAGCVPVEQPAQQTEEEPQAPEQTCTEMWICISGNELAYKNLDCTFEETTYCEDGCENGKCKEEPIEESKEEAEEQEEIEEEPLPEEEQAEISEEEQIKKILDLSETKIKSYLYKYKSPSGMQYIIYFKNEKIKIDSLSSDNDIYIDKEKKTAEEWCTSHTRCGRQTGKIADLDYYDAYIDTPIDWLPKITDAVKIDEGFYYGKKAWKLNTNIGEVTIDSNFGFIYSIKQGDKGYLFTDASFNTVKDSDVTVPEYLLQE